MKSEAKERGVSDCVGGWMENCAYGCIIDMRRSKV